jgi:indolepyruvate ferredoxin oxidoreductase beta subunit
LLVSRILAEAAIGKGLSTLTSEIHGMAQRGGTVVSHLKVGGFSGPLIREGRADGLIVLRDENLVPHSRFLAPSGWAVVNSKSKASETGFTVHAVDADGLARESGYARGTNIVLLGFLISRLGTALENCGIFCGKDDLRQAIERRFADKRQALEESLAAFDLGIRYGKE